MNETAILDDLHGRNGRPELTYKQTADLHGIKVTAVWRIAVKHEARNEARIREREAERRGRRRETLQAVVNATVKSDVLDFLDGLPDDSVDLHCTSIPYNVAKPYGGCPASDRRRYHRFIGWTLEVLSEKQRTLAPGGVLFLQLGTTRDDHDARHPLDVVLFPFLEAMGLVFQSRVIWRTTHGLAPKGRLAERYETALVFSKGPPKCFNADAARIPQKQPDKRAFRGPNKGRLSGNPLGAWPTDVWDIPTVRHGHPEKTGHPAQFPQEIARRAILLYTLPGDLVCDAFAGSGTTAAEAKRTHRSFTGCDLFYEDLRAQRLARIEPDLASPLPGVTPQSVAVWQAEIQRVSFAA